VYKKVGLKLAVSRFIAEKLVDAGVPHISRDEAAIAARWQPATGSAIFDDKGEKVAINLLYLDFLSAGYRLTGFSQYRKQEEDTDVILQLWFGGPDQKSVELPGLAFGIVADELAKQRPTHVHINQDGSAVIDAPCPGDKRDTPRLLRMRTDDTFFIEDPAAQQESVIAASA